jgi:hypothetical protein
LVMRLLQELLPDQIRVLGSNHPNTLRTVEVINSVRQRP